MKVIGLATIFSMLFSFSALAGNGKSTIKTRYITTCNNVILNTKSDYYDESMSVFTFFLEENNRRLKDISGPTYIFISEYNNGNDRLVLKDEEILLQFEVIASGSIGSPENWEFEIEKTGKKFEHLSKTKWVQFHISANDETSPEVRKLVKDRDGIEVYTICTETVMKKFLLKK